MVRQEFFCLGKYTNIHFWQNSKTNFRKKDGLFSAKL